VTDPSREKNLIKAGQAMKVSSLGYRTDLLFVRFDGVILDRGDYVVARTESNPGYHWGNFLLFDRPPREGDAARWLELFEQEIASKQPTRHIAFGWDTTAGERGECKAFTARGFLVEDSLVMSASALIPPEHTNREVEVRPLHTDREWAAATKLQIENRDPCHSLEGYTRFKEAQMARYRSMAASGLGRWYGAFKGETLVADMGLFHDGEGAARYQSVETDADHRRQGICARLLVESARMLAHEFGPIDHAVIVADPEGPATGVYRSVGFEVVETQVGLQWWEGLSAPA